MLHVIGMVAFPLFFHIQHIVAGGDEGYMYYWYVVFDVVHLIEWMVLIVAFKRVREIMRFQVRERGERGGERVVRWQHSKLR